MYACSSDQVPYECQVIKSTILTGVKRVLSFKRSLKIIQHCNSTEKFLLKYFCLFQVYSLILQHVYFQKKKNKIKQKTLM